MLALRRTGLIFLLRVFKLFWKLFILPGLQATVIVRRTIHPTWLIFGIKTIRELRPPLCVSFLNKWEASFKRKYSRRFRWHSMDIQWTSSGSMCYSDCRCNTWTESWTNEGPPLSCFFSKLKRKEVWGKQQRMRKHWLRFSFPSLGVDSWEVEELSTEPHLSHWDWMIFHKEIEETGGFGFFKRGGANMIRSLIYINYVN